MLISETKSFFLILYIKAFNDDDLSAEKEEGDSGMNHSNNASSLDQIRLNHSVDDFRSTFHDLGEKHKPRAITYINEERLSFPSLFILMPEMEALNLYDKLNARNLIALKMCAKILKDESIGPHEDNLLSDNNGMIYPVLKWMLTTGSAADGLNDEYDIVIDGVASLLIKTYKDTSVLPVVADLIFKRHRKGYLIHDLVWCFFQARDPICLRLIAGYIRSPNQRDVDLAFKLLHFAPNDSARGNNRQKQYQDYLSWLQENKKYLYFTGENFQHTSNPEPCSVDLDAKYLCKEVSAVDKKPLEPLTETDNNRLKQFHEARQEDEEILSKYSHRIHDQNIRLWNQWIEYPVSKQIEIAKSGNGGAR